MKATHSAAIALWFVAIDPEYAHAQNESAKAMCFEVISPSQTAQSNQIMLDRCTGATWLLVRVSLPDMPGRPSQSFTYQWEQLTISSEPPILSYNTPPIFPQPVTPKAPK